MIDPVPIYEAGTAFWKSAVLFAACRLGVFDALEEAAGAAALAQRLDLSERGTAALLDAWPKLSLRLIVGPQQHDFPGVLKPGVWQHVAVVIDRGLLRVYLGGQPAQRQRGG